LRSPSPAAKRGKTKARVRGALARTLLAKPRILRVKPSLSLFLLGYMKKFRVRSSGGNLILHSHLPPLNSEAYGRFVDEHLVAGTEGPSHAQVGLTNACPQRCAYCYNRDRQGTPMDTETILGVVRDLRDMGVFWIGLTGGEPLLNKDLTAITEAAADGCAVKLFTTGWGVTPRLARDLHRAGLFSVSVSLDHWREDVHDAARGCPGAFRAALEALEIFRRVPGLHVGVSAVLTRDMIRRGETEAFLDYLVGLGVDEAWLSEVKPVAAPFWDEEALVTDEDIRTLVRLQDRHNREGRITVNYLGHFEARENFGCNAGRKMIYVDAFGDVSPCVFTPVSFGNVRDRSLREIAAEMRGCFRPSDSCFIRRNVGLFKALGAAVPLGREAGLRLAGEAGFGVPGEFIRRWEKARKRKG